MSTIAEVKELKTFADIWTAELAEIVAQVDKSGMITPLHLVKLNRISNEAKSTALDLGYEKAHRQIMREVATE